MPGNAPPEQIVELKAGGPDDPDGTRTASVLAAYFHAEHMKAFRRLLWRRLGVLATVWFLVGITTEILSKDALFVGLGVMGAVAAWAAAVEWRAAERLSKLIAENR